MVCPKDPRPYGPNLPLLLPIWMIGTPSSHLNPTLIGEEEEEEEEEGEPVIIIIIITTTITTTTNNPIRS